MTIKAIETLYARCRFRSRTEARWAVFFDALGIEWEYEKEGFELPSGKYLPDFWLPKAGAWAEVKGGSFSEAEKTKCLELTKATGEPCIMLDGIPKGRTYWAFEMGEGEDVRHVDFDLCSHRFYSRFFVFTGLTDYPETAETIYARGCPGLLAASSARFERGESGDAQP